MNPSASCPTHDQLLEIVSGSVSALQADLLEQHLLECASCNSVTAEVMEHDPLVKLAVEAGWPAEPVDVETEQLSRRIAAAVETRLNAAMETLNSRPVRHDAELDLSWLEPAESPNELGRLGNFVVFRLLGRGGMGAVFEAEDMRLRRRVALKVILPGRSADKSIKERFLREARAAAAVHHRHVVTIFEVGESGSVPYLAMELLRGESLQERLQRGGHLSPSHAAVIAAQVADGLAAAHQLGLLHRDIKPGNIWLESPNPEDDDQPVTVKLLDFGLAKPMGTEDGLTQSGLLVGTLRYLSPEQARGTKLDARSDLFSLGCTLYQMLSGAFPFEGSDPLSQLNSLATMEPMPIRDRIPEIPDSLASLIHGLLARNAADRPSSAKHVALELRRISGDLANIKVPQARVSPLASPLASGNGRAGIRRHIGIFSAGFVPMLILLGIIVITIRHRDGTKTEIKIDLGGNTNPAASNISSPGQSPSSVLIRPPSAAENTLPVISLSHLDATAIPESERFDWQPKELVAVIGEHQLRHWSPVTQVRFHPSGQFFITVPDRGEAALWMTTTLERRADAFVDDVAQTLSFDGLEFSQDGKWLSSANLIYAVDLTNPDQPRIRLAQTLASDNHRFGRSGVAIHDSRWLMIASETPGELMLWDIGVNSGRFRKLIPFAANGAVTELAWSSDGRQLIGSRGEGGDGVVHIWDIDWTNPDDPIFTLRDHQISGVDVVLSPQGSTLAAGGDGYEKTELWDTSQIPFKLLKQIQPGREFAFSTDGMHVAVATGPGIQLYEKKNAEWVSDHALSGGMGAMISLAWSPDQKSLVAGDQCGGVHVWDLSGESPQSRGSILPAGNVQRLTFAPDGRSMVVVGSDHQAALWNLEDSVPTRVEWSDFCDSGHLPSYSPDSQLVRVHEHVRDLATTPPSNISIAVSVLSRFVPNGNEFVSFDGTTLVQSHWELTKRRQFINRAVKEQWKSPGTVISNDAIETLQFEAQRFATRQDDQTVCVWSLAQAEKPLFELKHNLKFGNSSRPLTLSSDGTVLLAFSQQGSIVWDLEESPPREYPLQLDAHTTNAFFAKENKWLFVADGNGVGVYDWANNREDRRLKYPGLVRQIVRHPDGTHMATVNGNGTVYILRIPEALNP
jgi:serine/threonine protein kinase